MQSDEDGPIECTPPPEISAHVNTDDNDISGVESLINKSVCIFHSDDKVTMWT